MKIQVINKTYLDKNKIRNLTKLIAKKMGVTNNIQITFSSIRNSKYRIELENKTGKNWTERVTGRAYIGSVIYNNSNLKKREKLGWHKSLKIRVPKRENYFEVSENVKELCQVMEHEFQHSLGLRHESMCDYEKLEISYLDKAFNILNGMVNE